MKEFNPINRIYYYLLALKVIRSLRRKGLIESYKDSEGTRRWKRTPLGEKVASMIVRKEDVR